MNNYILKKYVSNLTKDKLHTLATNYNIKLNNNEIDKVYTYIKTNYIDYFNNTLSKEKILNDLKQILTSINYQKITNLYLIYKDKI